MLNKVFNKAQLKQAIEQRGFEFISAKYWRKFQNSQLIQPWDLTIAYQGTEYSFEAFSVQGLLDLVEEELL